MLKPFDDVCGMADASHQNERDPQESRAICEVQIEAVPCTVPLDGLQKDLTSADVECSFRVALEFIRIDRRRCSLDSALPVICESRKALLNPVTEVPSIASPLP